MRSIVVLATSVGGEREMETNSRDAREEDPPVCMLQAAEVCGPEIFTSCVSPASVSPDFFLLHCVGSGPPQNNYHDWRKR